MSAQVSLSCDRIERYLGEEEERVHALRGVSLEIETGSVHAVVGPSGVAKVHCSIFSVCWIHLTRGVLRSKPKECPI
jgi:predicted ABC-type transport system involved in lysophospholipase L1 biosynthesis ATPase subunit